MVTADAVTTVSPTYAAQLRESAYAAGLDSVVRSTSGNSPVCSTASIW